MRAASGSGCTRLRSSGMRSSTAPGPNVIAYYLAFRVVGHFNSWRGARHGTARTAWSLHLDANLGELASLVDQPRELRASRVEAIAARLNLRRLSAFFDRVAA